MIVKHSKHRENWTGRILILGKEYPVLEIKEEPFEVQILIKNEQGSPALFPLKLFDVSNNAIPPHWKIEFYEKNKFSLFPAAFEPIDKFWEGYYEGDLETRAKLWRIVEDEINKINKFHGKQAVGKESIE